MKNALLCLLAANASAAWAAADADLLRCRALADRDARLACYDGLPVSAAAPPLPPAAAAPMPAAGASPPAAATSPAAATTDVASFGLSRPQAATADEITSTLPGTFEGWGPRTRFRLANGQVWQVSDDSSGSYWLQNPRVTVRRALLGGFVIDIDGVNRVLRVRRVE